MRMGPLINIIITTNNPYQTMLELASLKTTLHHNIKSGLVGAVANVCFTPLKLTPDEQVSFYVVFVLIFFSETRKHRNINTFC